jgi:hypothetical protein
VPSKPARSCKYPRCPSRCHDHTGYCAAHVHLYVPFVRQPDNRESSTKRGYGRSWRAIREHVLARHGIPRERWSEYDVDHNPAYNPVIEPDHTKYQLIPRLHAEHSRKTVREDGGWGKPKQSRGGGIHSLEDPWVNRRDVSNTHTGPNGPRGSE